MTQEPLKTIVIGCRMYIKDADEFKELCREKGEIHSEVIRKMILDYIKNEKDRARDRLKSIRITGFKM